MSRKIYLWRSTPVEVRDSVSNDHSQIPSSCILASARQGITKALYLSGLNRENFVAIPDYTSHCVIDFIGRLATPVPSRFIPPESASAVLIYDQWGWQKSADARVEVRDTYRGARLIWDRVDSLPYAFTERSEADQGEAHFQLFSLNKTLTASGGGLLWSQKTQWIERSQADDSDLVLGLEQLVDSLADRRAAHDKVKNFIRNECNAQLSVRRWLQTCDLDAATEQEHHERRMRLECCARHLKSTDMPSWMRNQLGDPSMPAPGIWPVRINRWDDNLIAEIADTFNVYAKPYHFNFNDSYLHQRWTKVLAIPLHSEVDVNLLSNILVYLLERNDIEVW